MMSGLGVHRCLSAWFSTESTPSGTDFQDSWNHQPSQDWRNLERMKTLEIVDIGASSDGAINTLCDQYFDEFEFAASDGGALNA